MQTATNQQTGQRYYLDPETNEWTEMQTATVQRTGQKFGLIGGQWVEVEKGRAQEEAERMTAFMERVPESIERGIEEYKERTDALRIGGYEPSASQKVSTAIATAGMTAGEIITDFAITSLPNSVRAGAEQLFGQVKDTQSFQTAADMAQKGLEAYEQFKQENPAAAATFENVIDVSVLFSPRPDLKVLEAPAERAAGKASRLRFENRRQGINQLLAPETLKPNERTAPTGFLGREQYVPDRETMTITGILEGIPDVDPKASYHHNMRAVQDHITEQAKKLRQFIVRSNNPRIRKNDLAAEMGQAIEEYTKSSGYRGITPDAQKIVQALAEDALTLVSRSGTKNTVSAMDLLNIRQEFDDLINEAYAGVLEATSASARSKASRVVRNILNDKLKELTPGDDARQLLDRQHNAYLARDRMNNKRNKEANTTLGIVARRLKDAALLPSTLGSLYFTGKTFVEGAGGIGAVAVGGAAGLGIYGTIRMLSKQNRLDVYAETLSSLNKLIRNTKESDKLFELKAHRLVILDLLRGEQESAEDE